MQTVHAAVNYLGHMREAPVFCGPEDPGTNLVYDARTVEICNARELGTPPSLEREGFELVRHETSVRDFQDRETLDSRYGTELAQLIRKLTGASEAHVVPGSTGRFANRRNTAKSAGTLPVARNVHWDYTDATARSTFLAQMARILDTDSETLLQRYRRIAIYQTWRALSDPPQDVPLTLVDGRTVTPQDLTTCYLGTPMPASNAPAEDNPKYADGKLAEFSLGRYSPAHRWYYYPDMQADELLVFKGYEFDSSRQMRVLHTAFDDPTAPADAPPRASIEVRLFAFFA